ncbi:MAG TPA: acyl carrier protein [Pilimelia sp.]|nr:acyl carrier protein [Pilimelia sp.]
MNQEVRQFLIDSLADMNYDVSEVNDDSSLGPAGLDLESLAIAELAVRVEDKYGVTFSEDESEEMAGMSLGEFVVAVVDRLDLAKTAKQD